MIWKVGFECTLGKFADDTEMGGVTGTQEGKVKDSE